MKIEYYDRINAEKIKLDVNPKVAHFIKDEKKKNVVLTDDEFNKLSFKKQDEYCQLRFERSVISLSEMEENGFELADNVDFEEVAGMRDYEKNYLRSSEYREFRTSLKKEIRNVFDTMSDREKKVMYLRFYRNCSISCIAYKLGISKSSAQEYIARGCKHIKYFLDKDIKEQDKLDKLKKMKREQKKFSKNCQN